MADIEHKILNKKRNLHSLPRRQASKFHIPYSDQRGFSLMEAIVATALFAFVVTSVLGVYISTLRLDAKTRAQRAVTQNARYIMEFLAKEVRNGTIQYSAYPGGSANGRNDLYVTNQEGILERIYLDSNQNLVLEKAGFGTTNLNSSSVRVTNASFRVSPNLTPFTPEMSVNTQPHVVVVLELTSNYGTKAGETAVINLQSTFTTRKYPDR